ncbi:MAG: cytochrome c [Bacteroidetes bacterium]|nr:cytochrome c [Bacteroidota bacterium]
MNKIKFIIISFCFLFTSAAFAQDWEVPENKKNVNSYFEFNDSIIELGKAIYLKNCMSCHGEPGKANFAELEISPGDIVTERFSKQTDGELFYKITNGKTPMPSFATTLKEDERWYVISYFRSFHKDYKQTVAKVIDKNKERLYIELAKPEGNNLVAKSFAVKGDDTLVLANVELLLFAKRYFGNLQLGEPFETDSSGLGIFELSETILADTAGNIVLIAKPADMETYGDAETRIKIEYGIKNTKAALNEERAIWNTLEKAPIWLIFTYLFGLIAVFSVIIYVVLQLVKMKKSS